MFSCAPSRPISSARRAARPMTCSASSPAKAPARPKCTRPTPHFATRSPPGRGFPPQRCCSRGKARRKLPLRRHHLLPLLAELLDAERDDVAGFEKARWLHAETDARRRAGDDHVARLHDEILRARPNDVAAIEDHGRGVAALAFVAVDVEPHVEVLRILDLVLGDEPRSERAKGLAAFAFGPLSGALDLKHALGDVVGEAIAGDHIERLLFAQIAGAAADDDAKLDLPVELGRILRDDG